MPDGLAARDLDRYLRGFHAIQLGWADQRDGQSPKLFFCAAYLVRHIECAFFADLAGAFTAMVGSGSLVCGSQHRLVMHHLCFAKPAQVFSLKVAGLQCAVP